MQDAPKSLEFDYSVEIFDWKRIKDDIQLRLMFRIWLKWWNFTSFNFLGEKIFSNDISQNICGILIKNGKKPVGFMFISSQIPNSGHNSTLWLKLDIILDPNEVKTNYSQFSIFLCSLFENQILEDICLQLPMNINKLAYIFCEFPETEHTRDFCKKFSRLTKKFHQWSLFHVPSDEIHYDPEQNNNYRDVFNLFYFNSRFIRDIPPNLEFHLKKSLELYSYIQTEINPFEGLIRTEFENVLQAYRTSKTILKDIQPDLEKYNQERNGIWNRFPNLCQEMNPLDALFSAFKQNSALLKKHHLTLDVITYQSPRFKPFIEKYKYEFLVDALLALPTQGSMFMQIHNEDGSVNSDIFTNEYWENVIGHVGGFLFYNHPKFGKIFLGFGQGRYRKSPNFFSRQLLSSTLVMEHFRGYALGEVLVLFSVLALADFYDIIYEESTVFNERTVNMVKRIGFESYGLMRNRIYAIDPKNPDHLTVANIQRYYWMNPHFGYQISVHKNGLNHPQTQYWQRFIELTDNLHQNLINNVVFRD
jgi:hypothetical protein